MVTLDSWQVLADFLSPGNCRRELLEDLRDHQSWLGILKKTQGAFPDHAGIVASCNGFIFWHLCEIERISRELKNAGDRS